MKFNKSRIADAVIALTAGYVIAAMRGANAAPVPEYSTAMDTEALGWTVMDFKGVPELEDIVEMNEFAYYDTESTARAQDAKSALSLAWTNGTVSEKSLTLALYIRQGIPFDSGDLPATKRDGAEDTVDMLIDAGFADVLKVAGLTSEGGVDTAYVGNVVEISKRARWTWVKSAKNLAKRSGYGVLQGYLGNLLYDKFPPEAPRSICRDGACLSWHSPVNRFYNYYLTDLVNDGLSFTYDDAYSLSGDIDVFGQVVRVCQSNRATSC